MGSKYGRMIRGIAKRAAKRRRASGPKWFVYILRCVDGSLYTGATSDVDRRFRMHAAGKGARYTRSRLPVRLVYREACRDRSCALVREWAVKAYSRPLKLRLIKTGKK